MKPESIDLSIFGCLVNVQVKSDLILTLLIEIFSAFNVSKSLQNPDLEYSIVSASKGISSFSVFRDKVLVGTSDSMGYLLYIFEKDLTVELQKIRSDLFFLHAAVLEWEGKCIVLIAPSGVGKSTTAWALINNSFGYLSDELAPINLNDMTVHGYPRALGLKQEPPDYVLPDKIVITENGIHVPVSSLKTNIINTPLPLHALLILGDHIQAEESIVVKASTSSAAQHIYVNSLNALSHENIGLEAAVSLAAQRPCFFVKAKQDLERTCKALQEQIAL